MKLSKHLYLSVIEDKIVSIVIYFQFVILQLYMECNECLVCFQQIYEFSIIIFTILLYTFNLKTITSEEEKP